MNATPTLQRFTTFSDFYPFYLSEHRDRNCRRMHFAGSSLWVMYLNTWRGKIRL